MDKLGVSHEIEVDWSEHWLRKGDSAKKTYYIIRRRNELVGLFSNYIVFAGHIRYAMKHGWIPVIDMKTYPNSIAGENYGKENVWEKFFYQPAGVGLEEAMQGENIILGSGDVINPFPSPSRAYFGNYDGELDKWKMLVELGVMRVKTDLYEEAKNIKSTLFKSDESVLGVHLRGTDYAARRPMGHDVVPPIEYALSLIQQTLEKYKYNKIFLTTEDKNIAIAVSLRFPNRCVTYNKDYANYDGESIITNFDKDGGDLYLRAREYLMEMLMLSMCDGLVTSMTSGSIAVMMMEQKFKHALVFDFGKYGMMTEKIKRQRNLIVNLDDNKRGRCLRNWYDMHIGGISTDKQQKEVLRWCLNYPNKNVIEFINDEKAYFSYRRLLSCVKPMRVYGHGIERVGNNNFGGHVMVDFGGGDIVIAFGDYYDEWCLQMAERGAVVHRFVSNKKIMEKSSKHSNIHYHDFFSMDDVFSNLKLYDRDDIIMQMCVTGKEWSILDGMSENQLGHIKQMCIDFHQLIIDGNLNIYERVLKKLSLLHQSVHIHYNNNVAIMCFRDFLIADVMRVTYVRCDAGMFIQNNDIFPTKFDAPTMPGYPDVYIGRFSDMGFNTDH